VKVISRQILEAAQSSGRPWCILRNEEEILEGRENDIDLFVPGGDYPGFLAHLHKRFEALGLRILRERRMPAGTSFLLLTTTGQTETQKLDLLYEHTLGCVAILPSDLLAQSIVAGRAYPVLAEAVAAELRFRKEAAREDFRGFLRHVRGGQRAWGGWPQLCLGGYMRAYLFNRRRPSGAFVVLVGPDGSGKTTVGEALKRAAKPQFFSARLYHFSIATLPRLRALLGRGGAGPDYTKPDSGTNAPIQSRKRAWVYTVYYGLDLLIWSHLRLKRRLRLGQVLIFDRYLHDWMFQRSYRNVPRGVLRWLLARAVQPDLVVYLTGDAAAIHARKPELSVQELATQQAMIAKDLVPFWQGRGVPVLTLDTTSLSVERIVADIRRRLTPV
jgi:energy-coupling factor transporter ATP-binding protein EcfA2